MKINNSENFMSNLKSSTLINNEQDLFFIKFDVLDAINIGNLAKDLGLARNLPIAVQVRIGDWLVYHASLPGSSIENQSWLERKARVVLLKQHSTLFERVSAEERQVDWYEENNLEESTHAIHGGGLPLMTQSGGLVGAFLVSGLPQVEDHLFGVEVLTKYKARKGELI
jgi:uncharacterized protein (UPF0303 family)